MEQCLTATAEGRSRKEREASRREEELTTALQAEDARITKEQEVRDKAAMDAVTSASSTEPRPATPVDIPAENPQPSEDVDQGGETM